MDINKAFRFVFDDRQWITKLIIGVFMSILAFLILPALIIQGYMIAIVRRVMQNDSEPLPEWTDWGKLLKDGFFVTVAQFFWTLPFLLVMLLGIGMTIGFGSMSNQDLAAAGATGSIFLVVCLGLLFAVALLFITPALYIQYAIKDDFGACFRFSEIIDIIRNNLADILVAFLVTVVAAVAISLVIGILGLIPCLGWIAAIIVGMAVGPYITFVTGHLYGQIAGKVHGGKLAGQLPKEPDVY
jgi:hypothetical protein